MLQPLVLRPPRARPETPRRWEAVANAISSNKPPWPASRSLLGTAGTGHHLLQPLGHPGTGLASPIKGASFDEILKNPFVDDLRIEAIAKVIQRFKSAAFLPLLDRHRHRSEPTFLIAESP